MRLFSTCITFFRPRGCMLGRSYGIMRSPPPQGDTPLLDHDHVMGSARGLFLRLRRLKTPKMAAVDAKIVIFTSAFQHLFLRNVSQKTIVFCNVTRGTVFKFNCHQLSERDNCVTNAYLTFENLSFDNFWKSMGQLREKKRRFLHSRTREAKILQCWRKRAQNHAEPHS